MTRKKTEFDCWSFSGPGGSLIGRNYMGLESLQMTVKASNIDFFSRRFMLRPPEQAVRVVSSWHFSEIFSFIFMVITGLGLIGLIMMWVLNFGPQEIIELPWFYRIWGIVASLFFLIIIYVNLPTFFQTLVFDFTADEVCIKIEAPWFEPVERKLRLSEFSRLVLHREKVEHRHAFILTMLRFIFPFIDAPSYSVVLLDLEHADEELTLTLAVSDKLDKAGIEEIHACGQSWAEKLQLPYVQHEKPHKVGLLSHVLRRGAYAEALRKLA